MSKSERRAAVLAELVRLLGLKRQQRGLSRNQLATLTGLNQSTISRLESNQLNSTMDSLLRVADELEVDLGELLQQALKKVDPPPKSRPPRERR